MILYFVVYDGITGLKEENWEYCHSKWRDGRRNIGRMHGILHKINCTSHLS